MFKEFKYTQHANVPGVARAIAGIENIQKLNTRWKRNAEVKMS